MSTHQYETLYGVGLLDDLHNYFPAILYRPGSFQSVPDLLQYLQSQARNRFDLFSLGQREYLGRTPPPAANVNVSSSDVNHIPASANSTLSAHSAPSTPPHIPNSTMFSSVPPPIVRPRAYVSRHPYTTSLEYMFNVPDFEDETVNAATTTRLLQSLLSLPLGLNSSARDAFLQPVVVRPTAEQIAANTTVGNLVSDEEQTCAICQDVLQPEQEGRKLNHCGHWFHKSCIDTWFDTNVHCPVCRRDIREGED